MIHFLKISTLRILLLLLLFSAWDPATIQAQDEEKKVENPIGKFFRDLNKNVRDGAEELQKAQQGRDQLDGRVPLNQDLVRRLSQAKEFLKQSRWHEAVTVLQFIVESPSDSFLFNDRQELHSLHTEAERLLSELPADARRNYLNRYEPPASREFEQALDNQDNEKLSRIAHVFGSTAAGRNARYRLTLNLRDQGHLLPAARSFANLARTAESSRAKNQLAQLAARCAADSGESTFLLSLIDEFSLSSDTFPIDLTTTSHFEFSHVINSTQLINTGTQVDFAVEPQFLPVWTQPTVHRFHVEEQIRRLFGDLQEANRAIVPTSQAVINGQLIAYHTLSGLEVRHTETGEFVWGNRTTQNLELILTGSPDDQTVEPLYRGRVPEQHSVTSYLLRDGVSRSLTTDGRHLFTIENQTILSSAARGYAWQRRLNRETPEELKLSSNEIVAYDFETGRVRWRLGGKVLEDPFVHPLAGTFFFGPPVSDGSDLYVIGEREGTVSLFVLNAMTGELLWSQELANTTRNIIDDQVRRFWPCFPAIQDGVIICPTTCGWLVAVDRASHHLMWASRYSIRNKTRQPARGGFVVQSVIDLNRRWLSVPPTIVGQHVLMTPPELPNEFGNQETSVFCFDLQTGTETWRQPKGDGLYLAGIDGENAIFVGNSSIHALNIKDSGRLAWSTPMDGTAGRPSGRSLILNRQLLVPIGGKSLMTFDLASGELLSTIKLESSEIELGNLYGNNDRLFSLSMFNSTAFPIRKLTEQERQEIKKSFASEFIAIEYFISNQKYPDALAAIQELNSSTVYQQATQQERLRLDALEWNCMEQIVLSGSEFSTETLLAMQTLADTPDEIARYQRLAAEQELQAGDWKMALRHLLSLLEKSGASQYFAEGTRTVRVDAWVGGRIQDLYENISTEQQELLVKSLQTAVKSLKETVDHNRLARLFSFLPIGQEMELELAKSARDQERFSEAIVRLQRVTHAQDQQLAARAWLRMGENFVSLNAPSDARRCWLKVLDLPVFDVANAVTSHTLAASLLGEEQVVPQRIPEEPWGDHWEAIRMGNRGNEQTWKDLETRGKPFEYLQEYHFLYQIQQQHLRVEERQLGKYVWSVPLRSMSGVTQRSSVGVLHSGPLTYSVHRGAIHAFQIPEQRVAWTYTPNVSGSAASKLRTPASKETSVVNSLSAFRNISNLGAYSSATGILATANEYGALVIDDQIRVLDPLTGELLWSESVVPKRVSAEATADGFLLCEKDQTEIRRSLDGKPTGPRLGSSFSTECLQLIEGKFLYLTQPTEAEHPWILSLGTLLQKDSQWSLELKPTTLLVKLDEQSITFIGADGEVSVLDLEHGTTRSLGIIPAELLKIQKRLYAYSDEDFMFIAVAHGDARTSYVSLSSLRASGTILCFAKTGGLLWSQETQQLENKLSPQETPETEKVDETGAPKPGWSMNLIVEEIRRSPLLLFISDRPENRDKIYFRRLMMVGLDKRTGEQVFGWHRISNSGGFSYLHVDVRDRYIDLRTYNERLKIRPVSNLKVNASGVSD